ncbi:MAG: sigma-70 family RNA polymerase sigma factor [Firmicutes bacterium]|nr:sigma-70 family RNA polymerase sigma factor [Bacillota bacterium]
MAQERIRENAGLMLDKYGDSILRLAYSYLHNMSDAEDIVQDTLIKYMKTGPEFESEAHEKAWLLRVAANLSKNKIDYNKVRQADELEETLAADERKDLSFVWEAVKMLPDNYREAIHLFYYEGYSTREIAGILKRNEATVRSDLKRGRDKLRTVLTEVYDFG